jgi:hypothetical protein
LIDSEGRFAADFESANWNWSSAGEVQVSGFTASNFVASVTSKVLDSDGKFVGTTRLSLRAMVFRDTGKVQYGSRFVGVSPGSVVLSYTISSWPFTASSSKLYLSVTMSSAEQSKISAKGFGENARIFAGDAYLNTPNLAISDSQEKQVDVLYFSESSSSAGVIFALPYFSESLRYDIVGAALSSSSNNSGASVSESSSSVYIGVGAGSVCIVIAAGILVLLRRRKRQTNTRDFLVIQNKSKRSPIVF